MYHNVINIVHTFYFTLFSSNNEESDNSNKEHFVSSLPIIFWFCDTVPGIPLLNESLIIGGVCL